MNTTDFANDISKGYSFEGESIILGAAVLDGKPVKESFIRIPLSTINRHGLIAGATGTGKTKTLQVLAEQLSSKGVPTLVMDIKGDLSGIAVRNSGHPKIDERHELIGLPYIPASSPVEFLSLSDEPGARLRATVSEFGPVLFSKMLDLNETQEGIISVIFKFCDDRDLPLLDLEDLKKVIQYVTTDGKAEFQAEYGNIMTTSTGTIVRKLVELEQQGASEFFGEPSFDVQDLLRRDREGLGIVHVLRVVDIQDRPKLFSTFMLQLLAEIYAVFPEEGDVKKPKLVIFIDEAHLIFENASEALLDQIEVIIKLIRSKGVGIFFVTQDPNDIPEKVLSQLGLKVQHALHAFTAKDRKSIQLAAENFPETPYYKVDQLLTELGTGEALVTALSEKGIPTPLVHCYMRAPQSRMDVLAPDEIKEIIRYSDLTPKYENRYDKESAYEILSAKLEDAKSDSHQEVITKQRTRATKEKSTMEKVFSNTTTRQIGRTVARELTRGILGVLGVKTTTRRTTRKKTGWF
ncbi:MAG TPA: helicase HerA-like domain-containing protein [Saprospiraceae bacterium]|nr:helicase HerA-like domain-containing protein [Saprospiraceae bacterium]